MESLEKENLLNTVKFRNGIFYSNELIDSEFQSLINECKEYMLNAGVNEQVLENSPLAVSAYYLWCKLSRGQNPENLTNNPVLINIICQLKNKKRGDTQ